ncbi:hypothetical protein [Gloeothece citriformis]|nr:hypothetical protein [Gloeothece citriformis]
MRKVYPLLDPETLWSFGQGTGVFAASIHTANDTVAPRVYVKHNDTQVVFYDGCLVDCTDRFQAHNAQALLEYWDELPSSLEGQFVAIKVSKNPQSLEIVNDALGMYPVYYLRQGNTYLLSNSAFLLNRISDESELDPLGVSLFLSWGWVGSDRTLHRNIRVIPGGQHWKWDTNFTEPKRTTYFDRTRLAHLDHKKLTPTDIEELADKLLQNCQHLSQNFSPLECPITAGRDSRLLTSLLIRGNINAQFFTRGISDNIDVQIGTQIARHFNLSHTLSSTTAKYVIDDWEETSQQWVQQNNGMVSLAHFAEQPLQLDRLGVQLSGAGGEIARGAYNSPGFLLQNHSIDCIGQYLTRRVMKKRHELLHQQTITIAQNYLQDFVKQVIEEGFSPMDVPDVFYTYERVRRWAGISHLFNRNQHRDVFAPLCTRPFIEKAFSMSAHHRYTQLLHYQLISFLEPKLHHLPIEKSWPAQHPLINYLSKFLSRKFQKLQRKTGIPRKSIITSQDEKWGWLESKRLYIRELCLDQSRSSQLWDFIDRAKFERMISSEINPLIRQPIQLTLWDIATLFEYTQSLILKDVEKVLTQSQTFYEILPLAG